MLRYLRAVGQALAYPVRAAWRRPRTTLAVAGLLLVAAAAAGAGYLRHQWRAAQEALAADRPAEANKQKKLEKKHKKQEN